MAAFPGAAGFGIIGKLFGNAVSTGVGFGMGVALGPVLAPAVRDISNAVNSKYSFVFPEAGTLANGVAQGQVDPDTARRWASYSGVGDKAFAALVDIANTGPGVPVAFDLWRRNVIGEAAFRRAAKRQGLEPEWIDDLVRLKENLLDPADIARGIHRGLIPDPGLLKGTLPSGEGNVPAYPVYPIDALAEAEGQGIDHDRLGVLVGLQGLPMGSHEAAQAYFRAILTNDDYLRAIAEGNTRNEWADAIREQSRQIPSSIDGVQGRLRGWLTDAEMYAQTARHGMSQEDTDLLFKIHGRPPSWHQIWIGLQRGGTFDGPTADIAAPFLTGLRQSDLRPEWYNLLWHSRYNYPSAFVLRSLTQSGEITEADAREVLLFEGWEPTFAAKVSKAWATAKGSAAKEASAADLLALYEGRRATLAETLTALEALGYPADEARSKVEVLDARRVVSAKTTAIGDLHTKYKKGELSNAATETALTALGVAAWAVPEIVAAWQVFLTAEGGTPPV